MAHVEPVSRESVPELESEFRAYEDYMGIVPNSALTMARRPEILRAFLGLTRVVNGEGEVDRRLKLLVSLVASQAAGCRYCQAHAAGKATKPEFALEAELAAVWDFESSALFSDADRAALRLARDGAQVPNAVTPAHFSALRQHFDDGEIVEITAVIAVFGFLNRWNDTMATDLEGPSVTAAQSLLAPSGWEPGRHDTAEPAARM